MIGHGLKPGDLVRFRGTGQIGVAEALYTDGTARVWAMEWVGREVPVLARCACSLASLTWVHATDHVGEVRPHVPPRDWRNRLASVLTAIRDALR